MSSGGHSDDIGPEFYATIAAHITAHEEDIAILTQVPDDDPYRPTATRIIADKQRTLRHLRKFLPPTATPMGEVTS